MFIILMPKAPSFPKDGLDGQSRQILEWSGHPEKALHDFRHFSEAYHEKTRRAFDLDAVHAKRLLSIFGNSHFLSHFLIEHPEEADLLVASPYIETDKTQGDFQDDLKDLNERAEHLNPDDFLAEMTRFKYREFLRLTVKDLSEAASLQSILGELSDLAVVIIQNSLAFLLQRMEREFGKPYTVDNTDRKIPCGFCVIGMGKLGGRELNYSSDVDLQYLYTGDAGEVEGPSRLSNHEFFVKLSERLTRFLSHKSPDGFLYRVDLNLRPEGGSGTLANSLTALEHYYEIFGQEWERQALIRMAPVAGDPELGKEFREITQPFVWRKSLDLKTIEAMKEMKRKVHDSAKGFAPKGFHVKLGEGGIREVEFFVQTLQLLYGGQHPELRTASTLAALEALQKLRLIETREAAALEDAYLFLRRLEHRLQMLHEAQTHSVPLQPEEQRALARRMGYFEDDPEQARERLLDDLTRTTTLVKTTFKNLFKD